MICWHAEKVSDTRNPLCVARRNELQHSLELPKDKVESRLMACIRESQYLRKDAPSLQRGHLQRCLCYAQHNGYDTEEVKIKAITKREDDRLWQRCIKSAVHPPTGCSVMRVQLNDPKSTPAGLEQMLDTEDAIMRHAGYDWGASSS